MAKNLPDTNNDTPTLTEEEKRAAQAAFDAARAAHVTGKSKTGLPPWAIAVICVVAISGVAVAFYFFSK